MIETSKSCHFIPSGSAIWLVDNGSLRAQSVFALREQALLLGQAAGCTVEAVSVLHSNKIPPEAVGGVPAATFTPHLRALAAAGLRQLLVVPYFFGPSAALTEYLPQQIRRVRQEHPELQVQIAPPLVDLADPADDAAELIASLLAKNIGMCLLQGSNALQGSALGGALPEDAAVVLVDHGSPQPGVSAVRDRVGQALQSLLGQRDFAVCSMEAREGELYAHTLPLLEQVLGREPFCRKQVVLAPLFLSPGRHAGAGGDLAQIVERVKAVHPLLDVVFSPLPGGTPELTRILLRRLRGGLGVFSVG